MSQNFPTDKDNIINDLEDEYDLDLTDQEYDSLRKLTKSELYLITLLMSRAVRKAKEKMTNES